MLHLSNLLWWSCELCMMDLYGRFSLLLVSHSSIVTTWSRSKMLAIVLMVLIKQYKITFNPEKCQ